MKRYREYMINILKAVSHGIFMYSCLYVLSSAVFSITPNRLNLPAGIISVLIALILSGLSNHNPIARFIDKYFMILGAVFSAVLSFLFFSFLQHSTLSLILSILYYIYLWKLGWDLGNIGFSYDEFKNQFLIQFKILILLIIISAFLPESMIVKEMGQYFTAFAIISPIILRYSRDCMYASNLKGRKTLIINILSAAGMVLVLLFVSSASFIDIMSMLINYASIGVDKALTFIISIISYPIGYLIYLIITLIQKLFKPNTDVLDNLKPGDESNKPLQDISTIPIPPWIILILKITIPVILAVVLIKMLSKHMSKNARTGFSERKESVFSLNEVGKDIGKSLSSIFKRKRKVVPVTISEKIRFLYAGFLELSVLKGIYNKPSQTVRDIKEKSLPYAASSFNDIERLTDIYENARYSSSPPSQSDLDLAGASYNKIKEAFGKTE